MDYRCLCTSARSTDADVDFVTTQNMTTGLDHECTEYENNLMQASMMYAWLCWLAGWRRASDDYCCNDCCTLDNFDYKDDVCCPADKVSHSIPT